MNNINFFLLKKDIFKIKYALIPIIIYCIIMQIIFKTVCPLKALTGIDCPACGLTRAAIYLFTGQIEKSLQSNPTFILWFISILLFIIDRYYRKLKVSPFPCLFIITALVTIIYYVIKMLT